MLIWTVFLELQKESSPCIRDYLVNPLYRSEVFLLKQKKTNIKCVYQIKDILISLFDLKLIWRHLGISKKILSCIFIRCWLSSSRKSFDIWIVLIGAWNLFSYLLHILNCLENFNLRGRLGWVEITVKCIPRHRYLISPEIVIPDM